MTEEEYKEWKKEREGGKQDDQDTGIDWGMGKIKLWFEKGKKVCELTCYEICTYPSYLTEGW